MVILNVMGMFNTYTFTMQIPFFVSEKYTSNSVICEESSMSLNELWREKQIQKGGEFCCAMFVSSRMF